MYIHHICRPRSHTHPTAPPRPVFRLTSIPSLQSCSLGRHTAQVPVHLTIHMDILMALPLHNRLLRRSHMPCPLMCPLKYFPCLVRFALVDFILFTKLIKKFLLAMTTTNQSNHTYMPGHGSHVQPYVPHTFDTTGQIPPPGAKPRVTATLWEDEGSLCFQVEAKGVCVARREGSYIPHIIYSPSFLSFA